MAGDSTDDDVSAALVSCGFDTRSRAGAPEETPSLGTSTLYEGRSMVPVDAVSLLLRARGHKISDRLHASARFTRSSVFNLRHVHFSSKK